MSIEFKLPDMGENFESGEVISVSVSEGDEIRAEQEVCELETEKATAPISCPHAGRVEKVHIQAGDSVAVGDTLLTIAEAAEGGPGAASAESGAASEPEAPAEEEAEAARAPAAGGEAAAGEPAAAGSQETRAGPSEGAAARPEGGRPSGGAPPAASPRRAEEPGDGGPPAPAGPATRRLARELGVDLHGVRGSGPGGRITRDDVKHHVHARLSGDGGAVGAPGVSGEAPALPDFSAWGEVERQPLSGIRRATARAMAAAWSVVPHVTQFDEANVTRLETARKRHDRERGEEQPKITVTAVAVKAAAAALGSFPRFNASLDSQQDELVLKKYVHIGVAVDTEHGLLVPVIRDADRKSVEEIAGELGDLASRARRRKIDRSELQGGTFTITNLGGIGGTGFTPVVNWPEVAILGMARARQEPVLRDGNVRTQLILPLSLSYDHRVIDGADGARFLRYVATLLEDPFRLLLRA